MKLSPDKIPSVLILGVRVHLIHMGQVLDIISDWIEQRDKCHYIVATQMHGIMEARRDPGFKTILNSANLFVPDGFSLIWAARRRGFKISNRIAGPDLFMEGCRLASERGYKVFFYGDTTETLKALSLQLKDWFPTLKIVGMHSPPFRTLTPEEEVQVVSIINEW